MKIDKKRRREKIEPLAPSGKANQVDWVRLLVAILALILTVVWFIRGCLQLQAPRSSGKTEQGIVAAAGQKQVGLAATREEISRQAVSLDGAPRPAVNHSVPAIQDTETREQRDARMAWWREARYGMFLVWGPYSMPAGTWHGKPMGGDHGGEWIMSMAKIPVSDYTALAKQFNPANFDADAWVALAKAAGMKYIIFTAKFADGFAMYQSKVSPFNIVDATPFRRDPLKELAAACRKQGIKLGFYYSQSQDWTAPGAAAVGGHWDKAQNGDFATYLKTKAIPQLKELLTHYGNFPAVLWFDTPTEEMKPELAAQIVEVLNRHPNLIWNNRLGGGYGGDTETPEQQIPSHGYSGRDWETCMTINGTWGYESFDTNFKSPETLLRNLIDIASNGGNYLLDVGPDGTGAIPQAEQDRLRQIGRWLRVNGEAIYGAGPTPFGAEDGVFSATEKDSYGHPVFKPAFDWRCTTKPGRLFIHLFKWPGASFVLPGVKQKITKAYMLADPNRAPLAVTPSGTDLTVSLPANAPDPIASVLVLETQ